MKVVTKFIVSKPFNKNIKGDVFTLVSFEDKSQDTPYPWCTYLGVAKNSTFSNLYRATVSAIKEHIRDEVIIVIEEEEK